MPVLDREFYRTKSWGAVPVRDRMDLPSLKLRRLMELLRSRSRADARLLEVGSGSGRIIGSIRERDRDLDLTGLDLSPEQTELARRSHPTINFVCGNGENLPFPDQGFDFVVVFDYLEHIERPEKSLAEIHRVLAPGGRLHLVCPAEDQSIYRLSTRIFGRHFKESTAGHIQRYSRRGIRNMVTAAGLRVVELRYSYHLVGSLLDYTLFTLMLHPAMYRKFWNHNRYYARAADQRVGARGFNLLLAAGNAIAYWESRLLGRLPLFATAVHLTAVRD